jgi:hypothetical protein
MHKFFMKFHGELRMKNSATILLAISVFALVGLMWLSTASGSTVTVTATVATSVTCSTDNSSTAFGTLTSGSISTSTPNASTTLSCNTGLGCTLSVSDSNHGLATTSPAYTINSGTATLSAGTEGYGIQATTTATGSGGTLTINAIFGGAKFNSNDVGMVTTTAATLASSTASVSNREVVVKHKAAISGTTQAGSYSDTVTYSCTGN